jgi:hypothetical protein
MPAPTMDSQRMLGLNALSHVDVRVSKLIFFSHEPGWWRGKAFWKDFRKGREKDLCRTFSRPLTCNVL